MPAEPEGPRGTVLPWTPALVAAFWDGYSASADPASYFTAQVPEALTRLIAAAMPSGADLLDLGCGPGRIGLRLMERGYGYFAADRSPASVAAVAAALGGHRRWLGSAELAGTAIPLADASVDGVLLFETLEHLLEDEIDAGCVEIRRVLRPGGRLLVTVPNAEDLGRAMVYCPVCRHSFHRMQHQRSFTAESLRRFLEARGFRTAFCGAGDLAHLQAGAPRNPLRWSAIGVARAARVATAKAWRRLTGGSGPWLRAAFPGDGPNLAWCGMRT
jgi:SAM-dependent methyltransferase